MSHQFNYTTSERRASTSVIGSLGRSGLFVPQDFIQHTPKEIDDALESMDEDHEILPTTTTTTTTPGANASNMTSPTSLRRYPSRKESVQILNEEARLLKANHVPINIAPATTSQQTQYGSLTSNISEDEDAEAIIESWDEAVKSGKIVTTPTFELQRLGSSSVPLVITFLLQNSLSVCSVFAVGHISSEALAGITLGAMSSNITAIAIIAGLASSLDTFLPQAYGAQKYHLVGLIFQRCSALIFCIMIVVCTSWWLFSERLLVYVLPDLKSARYAAQYLKVTSFGIPGYILFETGKRFLQAQGIFDASTYVLFVCAPLNAIMNYTFVWTFKFGYIGAPIAVAINYTLMALGLLTYTVYTKNEISPMKCWGGLDLTKVFKNWGDLIRLSIPNLIMIMSEFLSFEILTLLASYLGTTALASQSVLATMASLTYQIPYGVSIAASTRIANFLGAQLPNSAYITCKMTFISTIFIAVLDFALLYFGRSFIGNCFSNDEDVIELIIKTFPIVAIMQIFDALNTTSAGCLRGQGLQRIGGYVNLFAYYLIGLPMAVFLAFKWPAENPMGLTGLWTGVSIALFIIGIVQTYCCLNADYDQLVEDAIKRSNSE